ncbi:MAG: hypothetical protein OEW97_01710 [Gammaproteobacteria bacterium]|nr:hypothetical protein [Gammaproteobacteria bacterium]
MNTNAGTFTMIKATLTLFLTLIAISGLSGCNSIPVTTNKAAIACEQAISELNQNLNKKGPDIHKLNINRANSLLIAAQVQHQFAEYSGCVEKVQRAKQYLNGRQTAILSHLTI